MLNNPTTEELLEKLGTEKEPISRFELCAVVSKSARRILSDRENNIGIKSAEDQENALTVACKRIADGKIIIMRA